MTLEQEAIIKLAECIKELVRIDPHYGVAFEGTSAWDRLNGVYKKASEAKNSMERS